ncbi:MAG: hypothetical protein ACOYYS_14015 [Chloroflexota bacterium]
MDKYLAEKRSPYTWDYPISEDEFQAMLAGKLTIGRLGRDWAALRLLEYGRYPDIIRMLGYRQIVENWPHWRSRIRSESRKRGFDFLVEWLPQHHPELLTK